jgi:hypothetical protein
MDPDTGRIKTYGSDGSGSATLLETDTNDSLLTWLPCPWPPLGWTRPPGRDNPTARTLEGELHGANLPPSPEQIR